ncbi:MAG: beta-lactamase family protein [Acidobacteriota bacterium]
MLHTVRTVLGLVLSVFVLTSCSRNRDPGPEAEPALDRRTPEEIAAILEETLPDLMGAAKIPGLSICLIDDFQSAWCDAFGIAIEGVPATTETVFQAASLSKPVFAYTVLRMVDEGVLDLDAPLIDSIGIDAARANHLGESFDDPRVREITARMVMTHRTGFPNWRGRGELTFIFDPDERFGYSGEGFGLLQKVVERVTGTPMEELVTTYTFEPLGMTSSTYTASEVDLDRYAWPHRASGEVQPKPDDFEERRKKARPHAAASLVTTASDYARFLVALSTGEGLADATHEDLLRPQSDVGEDGLVSWGLGTGLERVNGGVNAWHWGDNGDTKAFFVVDPRFGDGVVYFANSYNGLSLAGKILELVMPGDHPLLEGALLEDYPAFDSTDFRLAQVVYAEGADGGLRIVENLRQRGEDMPGEAQINDLGYWLMREDRLDEAIELFELNVELYPDAWNVYDSLGEAQLAKGLREQGIENYRRSLELNPDNENAKRVIAEAGSTGN